MDASRPRKAEATKAAARMVRPIRWKGQTQAGGGHRPLKPMEGSNQAGGRHGPLDRWKGQTKLAQGIFRWTNGKGSDSPLPGFGWLSGALTPAGSREFKGRPRDNKTIGSVQPKLPFSRSVR